MGKSVQCRQDVGGPAVLENPVYKERPGPGGCPLPNVQVRGVDQLHVLGHRCAGYGQHIPHVQHIE
jgi:hypothetical protein